MSRYAQLPRLCKQTLPAVQAATVPAYTPPRTGRIAHVGLGGFSRAHLAVYADDLLAQGWPAGIHAVSLRTSNAERLLSPQDLLYTVAEVDGPLSRNHRVVGSLVDVRTGAAAAVSAIASADTAMVTLTITEKGYTLPDLDCDVSAAPQSAPAVLAYALQVRRHRAAGKLVVAPLDNLARNGDVLRQAVLAMAAELDPELPSWINDEVRFANSVVDRIVPTASPDDLAEVARALHVLDLAAVTAEPHRSWVISDVDGLPPLGDVGVEIVADTAAYERRKLWLLNGPHSAFAYCGLLTGKSTIAASAADHDIRTFVESLVGQVLQVADLPPDAGGERFANDALGRFGNTALGHTCVQVAADGSQKLAQRLLPVVAERSSRGLPTFSFAVVMAAWLASVASVPIEGQVVPAAADPTAAALRDAYATGGQRGLVFAALGGSGEPRFLAEVEVALGRIAVRGMSAVQNAA